MSGLDDGPPAPEPASAEAPAPLPSAAPTPAPTPTAAPASRADVLATLAIVGAVLAFVAWEPLVRRLSSHPSADQCAALLDRYVEHVAYAVDPSPSSAAIAERRALARAAAQSRTAFARCEGELTLREVDCAMNAPNADTLERCLPQR